MEFQLRSVPIRSCHGNHYAHSAVSPHIIAFELNQGLSSSSLHGHENLAATSTMNSIEREVREQCGKDGSNKEFQAHAYRECERTRPEGRDAGHGGRPSYHASWHVGACRSVARCAAACANRGSSEETREGCDTEDATHIAVVPSPPGRSQQPTPHGLPGSAPRSRPSQSPLVDSPEGDPANGALAAHLLAICLASSKRPEETREAIIEKESTRLRQKRV